MSEKVLRFIKASPNGRRLGEIQKFIVEGNGMVYHPRNHRGYWCTNLLGYGFGDKWGLLESFCLKTEDRRYVVVDEIKPPFFKPKNDKDMPKAVRISKAVREREYELKKALAPKCANCGQANTYDKKNFDTPDMLAHFDSWSTAYKTDCKGRVWAGRYNDGGGLLTTLSKAQVSDFWGEIGKIGITWQQKDEVMHCYVTNHLVQTKGA